MSSSDSRGTPFERIEARSAEIGEGFTIRRALPTRQRRTIGAWCFFDHLGPARYAAGAGLHVGPHPHIGLQTFTWVMEGEILHRDSLGYRQIIRPGQVNLMTAGRGIAHAEDAPNEDAGQLHAAQLWIALPEAERHGEPSFGHYEDLPRFERGGFDITLLVGAAFGQESPVPVHSPLLGLDIGATTPSVCDLPLRPDFEHGLMVMSGDVHVDGETLEPGTLLYLPPGPASLALACRQAAHLLLIGGAPFNESILLWWNFVARSSEELDAATYAWNRGERFGEVVGSPSPRLVAPERPPVLLKGQ